MSNQVVSKQVKLELLVVNKQNMNECVTNCLSGAINTGVWMADAANRSLGRSRATTVNTCAVVRELQQKMLCERRREQRAPTLNFCVRSLSSDLCVQDMQCFISKCLELLRFRSWLTRKINNAPVLDFCQDIID